MIILSFTPVEKKCYGCKKILPKSNFHKGQKVCKSCNYARVKAWRHKNPDKWHKQDNLRKARKRKRDKEKLLS